MQVLKRKDTQKAVEIIDGIPVETDTPSILTDKTTIESLVKAAKEVNNFDINPDEYELVDAHVSYMIRDNDGNY